MLVFNRTCMVKLFTSAPGCGLLPGCIYFKLCKRFHLRVDGSGVSSGFCPFDVCWKRSAEIVLDVFCAIWVTGTILLSLFCVFHTHANTCTHNQCIWR